MRPWNELRPLAHNRVRWRRGVVAALCFRLAEIQYRVCQCKVGDCYLKIIFLSYCSGLRARNSRMALMENTWRNDFPTPSGIGNIISSVIKAQANSHLFWVIALGLAENYCCSYEEAKHCTNSSISPKDEEFIWHRIRRLPKRWKNKLRKPTNDFLFLYNFFKSWISAIDIKIERPIQLKKIVWLLSHELNSVSYYAHLHSSRYP